MWSKVVHTTIGQKMVQEIMTNTSKLGLKYHNIRHINSMYEFLAEHKVPYSEALDWAVLGHDYIYDADPFKEERSALALYYIMFNTNMCEQMTNEAVSLVLATKDHILTKGSVNEMAIIKADLHELAKPAARANNYSAIVLECANLYNLAIKDIQCKNSEFMDGLASRMRQNLKFIGDNNLADRDFFGRVIVGISDTCSRKDKPV